MSDPEEIATPAGGWSDPGRVEWYLDRVGNLKPRQIAESMLVEFLPPNRRRVLDLGCGDGRTAALVLQTQPTVHTVLAVDVSPPMLARASERFHGDGRLSLREWDLRNPLPSWGTFDLIVSGFVIHHLEDDRKYDLFGEVATQLEPGGVFLNLEVVASATPDRHAEFLAAIGRSADDPEDRLAPIEDQLRWMRDAGLVNVDCLWRWRGFALLAGEKRVIGDARSSG